MRIPCVAWPPNLNVTLVLLFALGCSDEGHRLGGEPRTCADGAEFESIDDMEDDDGTIDPIAGRGGVWLSWNDETGEQIPSQKDETFDMTELVPPRSGSHFAARSRGSGFTGWGAGIGFELLNQQPYDLSSYAGITFWARRAKNKSFLLRFGVLDPPTTPRGGQCRTEDCSDHFGANLELTTEFVRYRFTWAQLEQSGWGFPKPKSVDTSAVYALHFQVAQDQDFDFTIDDIALLCHPD